MTDHEKSRNHYEKSGIYDQNMEHFEKCDLLHSEQRSVCGMCCSIRREILRNGGVKHGRHYQNSTMQVLRSDGTD